MLLPVDDPSRVAEVRRAATQLASSFDFPEEAVGKIAIVATELADAAQLDLGAHPPAARSLRRRAHA
jgi:hypothetical protein